MPRWHFRMKQANECERNPTTGEYFDEEAIDRPAQALVREVIQNSLDARAGEGPVRVRFFCSGNASALPVTRARYWFDELWPHLRAPGSGLRTVPNSPQTCPYLVAEDFGTKGLEGDISARNLPLNANVANKNHFYAFFRAEGISENTGGRGRWGVGKTVFARSGHINAMLGLSTRQSDGRSVLMGKTVLRYHTLGATRYAPDGLFGMAAPDGFVLPFDQEELIDSFCADFRIERLDEPGLSVVVPYCHEEITAEAIAQAVAREYFHPILTGNLLVQVDDGENGVSRSLDACNLLASIGGVDAQLRTMILFSQNAHSFPADQMVGLGPPQGAPQWSDAMFSADQLDHLAIAYAQGHMLAVRVPVIVHEAGAAPRPSHFDVFLRNDLQGRGYPPVFVRNGIIIPKALERRVYGHNLFALVIIEDRPLAEMLANAEPPAHTSWSHNTQNFRGRYHHGRECIDFVRSAPRQLAEILSRSRVSRDRLALADFFPRPPEDEFLDVPMEPTEVPPPGDQVRPGRLPQAPSRPDPFEIKALKGGFLVKRANPDVAVPHRLDIRVAYDRSRGNPLKTYHPCDFDLQNMQTTLRGVREIQRSANHMVVEIVDDDFRVEVGGFDENRDIFVKADAVEV